jgi:hypothetical protein
MKVALALLLSVVASVASAQQVVTIHGAPQGVSQCVIPPQVMLHTIGVIDPVTHLQFCPFIEPQAHWKSVGADGNPSPDPPFTLSHDLAHAGHLGCNFPLYAETDGRSFTVPCRIMLFHTAGAIKDPGNGRLVWGDRVTATFDTPVGDGPLVGDPAGLKSWFFHATFNPLPAGDDSVLTPVPLHGWFVWRLTYRTFFDNGDLGNTEPMWSAYSVIDPSQPEHVRSEYSRPLIAARTYGIGATDPSDTWGISTVESSDDQCLPFWAPISTPRVCQVLSYMYNPAPLLGTYELLLDPDFHVGVPGTRLATRATTSTSGIGNFDFIDPLVISKSTPPMGYPLDGTHKLCATWHEASDPVNPTLGLHGGFIAPNEESIALLCFDVKVGPNPVGCDVVTCPVDGRPTPEPPSPPPPPPSPPMPMPPQCSVAGTALDVATGVTTITILCR